MNLAQKIAFNTGIQFVGQLIVLAIGLLTLRLTATYLGVTTFGQLSIVLSLTGLVAIIADLGVTTTLARELAKSPADADRLGGDLLRFRLFSSLGSVLLLLVAIPFLPYTHETKVALLISLPAMVFTVLGGFPGAFFQTHLRQELSAAVNVLTRSLGLVAILVVRLFDLGLYGLVGLLVAVNGIGCLVAFPFSRSFWRINVSFNWRRAKPLIRDSILIGLVSVIGLLHLRGDAIMLSLLKPADDVGIYAIAYRFIDQAFLLPGLFVATMFPIITRAVHHDAGKAQRAINNTFQALVLGAIAVTIMIYVLSGPLVRLVAGPEFGASATPLRILAFALLFMFVAPVFYNVLIVINKQKHLILVGAAERCPQRRPQSDPDPALQLQRCCERDCRFGGLRLGRALLRRSTTLRISAREDVSAPRPGSDRRRSGRRGAVAPRVAVAFGCSGRAHVLCGRLRVQSRDTSRYENGPRAPRCLTSTRDPLVRTEDLACQPGRPDGLNRLELWPSKTSRFEVMVSAVGPMTPDEAARRRCRSGSGGGCGLARRRAVWGGASCVAGACGRAGGRRDGAVREVRGANRGGGGVRLGARRRKPEPLRGSRTSKVQ